MSQNHKFVEILNTELKRKTIQDVEKAKENYKQMLAKENERAHILEENLKQIEKDNVEIRKQISDLKGQIEKKKSCYTDTIVKLQEEIQIESNKLKSLNVYVNELNDRNKEFELGLEKLKQNIDYEIRKRKVVERKVDAKSLERKACEKKLDTLKAKKKVLETEMKELSKQIEDVVSASNTLEEKYKDTVKAGRNLSNEYTKLEMRHSQIITERDCLLQLVHCHGNTNSRLASLIIENVHPCEDRELLSEVSEMMSEIDKQNNKHEYLMEQIQYEKEMRAKNMDHKSHALLQRSLENEQGEEPIRENMGDF